jgi:ABC-type glycerol-3-phosphate transport system substrate-binding protein
MEGAGLGGNLPDMVMAYPYQYRAWHAAGLVVDMTLYLADDQYGLPAEMQENMYPVFWSKDILGEQRLAFPAWHSGTMVFYNQSWAEELGFSEPPSTPAAFKNQACTAAAANGDFTGGWMINTTPPVALGWLFAFGVEVEASLGGYALNTSQTHQAMEFLYSLKKDLCAWKPGTPFPNEAFAARRGLFYTTSILSIPSMQDAFDIAENEDHWVPIPFPGYAGEPVIPVYGPSYVMLVSSEAEQLAVWIFTTYLGELENQTAIAAATGTFPASRGAVELLVEEGDMSDQWQAAAALLDYGKMEPRYASWRVVRYTLQDIIFDIFRDSYDPDTLEQLLEILQATAKELHLEAGGY